jgi:hypothetical protein
LGHFPFQTPKIRRPNRLNRRAAEVFKGCLKAFEGARLPAHQRYLSRPPSIRV